MCVEAIKCVERATALKTTERSACTQLMTGPWKTNVTMKTKEALEELWTCRKEME
jgi:hypothetical protein